MKKINKKGMTITEIIISVTLISIVLVFLFNLLISVRNDDSESQSASKLLINRALITKEVENDFINYQLEGIDFCNDEEIKDITPNGVDFSNTYCLKFTYNPGIVKDNLGFLIYYQYEYATGTLINVAGYKRGSNRIMRETDISPTPKLDKGTVKQICDATDNCSIAVYMPIIGNDDYDYGVNLSYFYNQNNITFDYTPNDSPSYGFKKY